MKYEDDGVGSVLVYYGRRSKIKGRGDIEIKGVTVVKSEKVSIDDFWVGEFGVMIFC